MPGLNSITVRRANHADRRQPIVNQLNTEIKKNKGLWQRLLGSKAFHLEIVQKANNVIEKCQKYREDYNKDSTPEETFLMTLFEEFDYSAENIQQAEIFDERNFSLLQTLIKKSKLKPSEDSLHFTPFSLVQLSLVRKNTKLKNFLDSEGFNFISGSERLFPSVCQTGDPDRVVKVYLELKKDEAKFGRFLEGDFLALRDAPNKVQILKKLIQEGLDIKGYWIAESDNFTPTVHKLITILKDEKDIDLVRLLLDEGASYAPFEVEGILRGHNMLFMKELIDRDLIDINKYLPKALSYAFFAGAAMMLDRVEEIAVKDMPQDIGIFDFVGEYQIEEDTYIKDFNLKTDEDFNNLAAILMSAYETSPEEALQTFSKTSNYLKNLKIEDLNFENNHEAKKAKRLISLIKEVDFSKDLKEFMYYVRVLKLFNDFVDFGFLGDSLKYSDKFKVSILANLVADINDDKLWEQAYKKINYSSGAGFDQLKHTINAFSKSCLLPSRRGELTVNNSSQMIDSYANNLKLYEYLFMYKSLQSIFGFVNRYHDEIARINSKQKQVLHDPKRSWFPVFTRDIKFDKPFGMSYEFKPLKTIGEVKENQKEFGDICSGGFIDNYLAGDMVLLLLHKNDKPMYLLGLKICDSKNDKSISISGSDRYFEVFDFAGRDNEKPTQEYYEILDELKSLIAKDPSLTDLSKTGEILAGNEMRDEDSHLEDVTGWKKIRCGDLESELEAFSYLSEELYQELESIRSQYLEAKSQDDSKLLEEVKKRLGDFNNKSIIEFQNHNFRYWGSEIMAPYNFEDAREGYREYKEALKRYEDELITYQEKLDRYKKELRNYKIAKIAWKNSQVLSPMLVGLNLQEPSKPIEPSKPRRPKPKLSRTSRFIDRKYTKADDGLENFLKDLGEIELT